MEDDDVADVRVREALADPVDQHALPDLQVGTIDSLGIRYGLTRKAWMPSARPRATATIRTSSTSEPEVERRPLLGRHARYSLALLFVTGGRRLSVASLRRLGVSRPASASASACSSTASPGTSASTAAAASAAGSYSRPRSTTSSGPGVAALADAGALADATAQVVELRAPDVAAGGDLDLLDLRRVERERALDADAEGLLADREGLAHPLALALDHDALEDLRTAARALDDLEVDLDAVTRPGSAGRGAAECARECR